MYEGDGRQRGLWRGLVGLPEADGEVTSVHPIHGGVLLYAMEMLDVVSRNRSLEG